MKKHIKLQIVNTITEKVNEPALTVNGNPLKMRIFFLISLNEILRL